MQHWHIYRKWNGHYSMLYLAYQTGRSGTDPSEFILRQKSKLYELYIIPLAKKLKGRVFGVSSDEYLNYAMKNRGSGKHRGQKSSLK
jgi:hypothetical protein